MKTADGVLVVIAGASRSGKTAYTRKRLAKARRVVAWDPEAQWCELPGWRKVTTRADLLAALQKPGPLKLAFVVGSDLKAGFDFWAQAVFWSGRFVEPLACIAEELADVSTPAKAPEGWGILIRRGLKRGISIYAISQRWSEADKTAFGNASEFVMFRQSSGDDVAYLSRKTRVNVTELDGLKPLEWVRYNAHTGDMERGKLKF
ncbi:hypothetical protein [Aquabacterium sp.]|uniref:hypothetical protein n=1 Tax=Aquabacterium sp. TaxID=1872578 RepID=UPI0025BDD43F|nr:hypothetical protein [Aquabacterium sp.]